MDIFRRNRGRSQGQRSWFKKRFGKSKNDEELEESNLNTGNGQTATAHNADIGNIVDSTVRLTRIPTTPVVTANDDAGNGAGCPAIDTAIHTVAQSASETLWDRAYDSLRQDNPQLVENYEKLLSKELLDMGTSSTYN